MESDYDKLIQETMSKYPTKTSALLPVLYILQDKYGSVTSEAMEEAARLTETSPAYVYGVFTFYTFYKREDEGKYRIWVCSTLSCDICGSRNLYKGIKERLGLKDSNTTSDKLFTVKKAECLGACEQGPVVQFEDKYIGNASIDKIMAEIEKIKAKQ